MRCKLCTPTFTMSKNRRSFQSYNPEVPTATIISKNSSLRTSGGVFITLLSRVCYPHIAPKRPVEGRKLNALWDSETGLWRVQGMQMIESEGISRSRFRGWEVP